MERGRLLWCDMPGRVEAIRIAPEHEQLPEPVDSIDVTGEGLPGDRYFGRGDITLVEAEALEAFTRGDRHRASHAEIRRQVLTTGIRLNDLLGKRFRVGERRGRRGRVVRALQPHPEPHPPGRPEGHGPPRRPARRHRPAGHDLRGRRGGRGHRRRRMRRFRPPGGSDHAGEAERLVEGQRGRVRLVHVQLHARAAALAGAVEGGLHSSRPIPDPRASSSTKMSSSQQSSLSVQIAYR